jgi:L-amino acid N-acyltransferase YncA
VTGAGPFLVRNAVDADLAAIVAFEIDIAVTGALGKPGEVTLVAVAAAEPDVALGWAWLSARTNSLTGAKYGNFRSLAVADGPGSPQLGELLLGEVLAAADAAGLSQLTGKVHAGNLGMRALYRKFGFTATHLTMERRPPAGPGGTS